MKKIVVVLVSILMLIPVSVVLSNVSSAESEPIDGNTDLEPLTVGTVYAWANVEYEAGGRDTYIWEYLSFEKGSDAEASFLEDVVLKNKTDYGQYAEYYEKCFKDVTISAYRIVQISHFVRVSIMTVSDSTHGSSSETLIPSYPAGQQQYMFYVEKGSEYSISIEYPETDYSAKIVGSSTGDIAELASGTKLTLVPDVTEDIVVAITPNDSITDSRVLQADVSVAVDGAYRPSDNAIAVSIAILIIAAAALIAIYVGWRRFLPRLTD